MSKKARFIKLEQGQALPIVVISLFALIAMAALMIDGGMLLSNRRTAQAAADAAALAGARTLCPTYSGDSTSQVVNKYVTDNKAFLDGSYELLPGNGIRVKTYAETPNSFFAIIFNETELVARAEAEAKCSLVRSASANLPIAFPCRAREYGADGNISYCKMSYYDETITYKENIEAGNIFMIMTSTATKENCYDPVTNPEGVNCDVNGDDIPDIVSNSSDGWLSLDGKSQLRECWLTRTCTEPAPVIYPRTWLSTISGGNTNWYKILKDYYDIPFTVPIYDKETDFDPRGTAMWEDGDIGEYIRKGQGLNNYRIMGFAQFTITCIHETGTDMTGGNTGSICEYRDWLIKSPEHKFPATQKLKSIEGYFTEGTVSWGGGVGPNLGLWVVQLTK